LTKGDQWGRTDFCPKIKLRSITIFPQNCYKETTHKWLIMSVGSGKIGLSAKVGKNQVERSNK
jgi:hypothetical protein